MIVSIKDKLRGNETDIHSILDKLDCTYIHRYNDFLRFGNDENSSGNANSININTLSYWSYSQNKGGDIIVLVSERLGLSTGEAIKWLAKELNIKVIHSQTDIALPFGGFFKDFLVNKETDVTPPLTYDFNRLKPYELGVSKMFIEDDISALTQEEFNIGYDIITNRITIPWLNEMGELIGIIGRLNKLEIDAYENKYFPIITFAKGKALYGFYENYANILSSGTIIVCESEKSVLKGREKGYNNIVALGCKNITNRQANLIKSTGCKVIIALDQDVELDECVKQAQSTKISNVFFSNEVYVVDMSSIEEKKVSLFDLDKGTIDRFMEENLIYIE